jgi:hypothetical protein
MIDNETRQAIALSEIRNLEQAERLIGLMKLQSRVSDWQFRLSLLIIFLVGIVAIGLFDVHRRLRLIEQPKVSSNP